MHAGETHHGAVTVPPARQLRGPRPHAAVARAHRRVPAVPPVRTLERRESVSASGSHPALIRLASTHLQQGLGPAEIRREGLALLGRGAHAEVCDAAIQVAHHAHAAFHSCGDSVFLFVIAQSSENVLTESNVYSEGSRSRNDKNSTRW